ncbi:DUF805 domain-containing protein [Vibrio coralliilyticus]|uniref:DUF805 domain-containing protein n=1 Tax=Vibrio coralliilyticus TaxID=190893 RepID=A0AAP6ZQ79_9VIBR|nr:DUF805 domain-containing protein [Vibrio coralliilyticus]MCC2525647.1 DUF805 domain-containing protein [Vibrio coralliilyticus]NOI60435.1 DUF805 domain-containing protein [Vibrio coralliilyticus]NOJ26176.1 DUF805 domain-containing protein [Vibrio coralliilyticus]NUW68747.1 DUF805 domain-containing protein [Vibrio coralliilyticus]PAT65427.1 hypothetical protein CKA27_24550 [Vibrio coralliilyticus]
MSMKELLFSFQGRVGRKIYWIWNVVYYTLIVGFAAGMNVLFPSQAHLLLPVFLIVVLIPDLAITAKRWHDRGKSSWWLLLNVPLVIGRMTVPAGDPTQMAQSSTLQAVSSLAALICGVWILVECGFLKGTQGENQYGAELK